MMPRNRSRNYTRRLRYLFFSDHLHLLMEFTYWFYANYSTQITLHKLLYTTYSTSLTLYFSLYYLLYMTYYACYYATYSIVLNHLHELVHWLSYSVTIVYFINRYFDPNPSLFLKIWYTRFLCFGKLRAELVMCPCVPGFWWNSLLC